ncbi:unnamed protein product [Clonostachys solani]|uniref:Uncharacterized protein n=1 Tax=Clonostachys solani TaxID=160281 RepID=A0A9N9W648_9HYPO|nr:unnamed protein product [Clonostachys solani]
MPSPSLVSKRTDYHMQEKLGFDKILGLYDSFVVQFKMGSILITELVSPSLSSSIARNRHPDLRFTSS